MAGFVTSSRAAGVPEGIGVYTSFVGCFSCPLSPALIFRGGESQSGLMKIIAAWQFGQVKRVICEPNSLSQRDYKPLAGGKRSATTGNA